MRDILKVNIDEIRQYSRDIASKVKGKKFDVIVPILKGGVVLASMLGRDLGINNFACLHIATTDSDTRNAVINKPKLLGVTNESMLKGANILLVDDICDSGQSLEFANEVLKDYAPQSITCCVAINVNKNMKQSNLVYAVDYSKENYWIVFPWED